MMTRHLFVGNMGMRKEWREDRESGEEEKRRAEARGRGNKQQRTTIRKREKE